MKCRENWRCLYCEEDISITFFEVWLIVCIIIEESKDLEKMKIDELLEFLSAHKKIFSSKHESVEKVFQNNLSLKDNQEDLKEDHDAHGRGGAQGWGRGRERGIYAKKGDNNAEEKNNKNQNSQEVMDEEDSMTIDWKPKFNTSTIRSMIILR